MLILHAAHLNHANVTVCMEAILVVLVSGKVMWFTDSKTMTCVAGAFAPKKCGTKICCWNVVRTSNVIWSSSFLNMQMSLFYSESCFDVPSLYHVSNVIGYNDYSK